MIGKLFGKMIFLTMLLLLPAATYAYGSKKYFKLFIIDLLWKNQTDFVGHENGKRLQAKEEWYYTVCKSVICNRHTSTAGDCTADCGNASVYLRRDVWRGGTVVRRHRLTYVQQH